MRPATQTPTTTIPEGAGTRSETPDGAAADSLYVEWAQDKARAVGAGLPCLTDLGRQLAAVEKALEAFQHVFPIGDERCAASWAADLLTERQDALQILIASQPATSMADAAVQIGVLGAYAALVSTNGMEGVNEPLPWRIERLAWSILPFMAEAAGFDIDAMNWRDAVDLRAVRFAGVGVTQ